MLKKIVSGTMLTLLLISIITFTFNIQPIKASRTIYIRADGSIEGTDKITSVENVTYTFIGNITDSIVVERSNIIVDGNGYTLQGYGGVYGENGFGLLNISNVTIKNTIIKDFYWGIFLNSTSRIVLLGNNIISNQQDGIVSFVSSNNVISENTIANYWNGIYLHQSYFNTVSGNNITSNASDGIVLSYSSNNIIFGNNIADCKYGNPRQIGVHLASSNNNKIVGNNITNNGPGIYLSGASNNNIISENYIAENNEWGIELEIYWPEDGIPENNTISENNILNNENGVRLYMSSNNTLYRNNIENNGDGISLSLSSNNSISGNNITANNRYGILLDGSSTNTIQGNNITDNEQTGVLVSFSSNNTVSGNALKGNKHNFYVGGDKLDHYMHSIDDSNLVDEKSVYYLMNQTDMVISSSTYPHVGWLALINCSKVDVTGLTLSNNGQGLLLAYTNNSRIIGNNVTNNDYGIYLESSSNCSISGNNITNNYAGIWHRGSSNNNIYENNIKANAHGVNLWDSSNSSISGNNITNNPWCGIEVEHSSNNTILQNNITNNGYGINLYVSLNNIINGNNMKTNYRGIVLAYSLNNSIVGNNLIGNSYGFQLDSSNYNIISGNNVTANNLAGILLRGSAYNKISGNNITNNGEGIVLQKSVYDSDSSTYNIISENNITNNLAGIGLSYSSNNVVYHNNFINNTSQVYSVGSVNVWDDGYPPGGNYWSNYTGVDLHSGSDQDETGSDGIGDTAHEIDADNRDRYPLMAPFTTFDAGIWNGETYSVAIVSNSTLSDFKLNATQKTLSFNVTGIGGNAGFCRVTIPNIIIQDLWHGNYTVLLNGEPWPFANWTDTTNTYIYINYTHSEHEIIIIPEFPSAIIMPLFMVLSILAIVFAGKRFPTKLKT